jgi:thiol peroxidase
MSAPQPAPRATFNGKPVTITGTRLSVGDRFPNATLLDAALRPVALAEFAGKARLFSVIPSLDTGICDAQTRRFNDAAQQFGSNARVITISTDLPFRLGRWQKDAEANDVVLLSDHYALAFGDAVGAHVRELRLLQRSVFVVNDGGIVTYSEYVPEIAQHPDYDAALIAMGALSSRA